MRDFCDRKLSIGYWENPPSRLGLAPLGSFWDDDVINSDPCYKTEQVSLFSIGSRKHPQQKYARKYVIDFVSMNSFSLLPNFLRELLSPNLSISASANIISSVSPL